MANARIPLLILFLVADTIAQLQSTLLLNQITKGTTGPNVLNFGIPPSRSPLNLTMTVCSDTLALPRFFIANSTNGAGPDNGLEVKLDGGLGTWGGSIPSGGTISVYPGEASTSATAFELAISDTEPLHQSVPLKPLLGDTTSTQAIIFSPPALPPILPPQKYPNYTVPIETAFAALPPTNFPNYTLILFPSAGPPGLRRSACGIRGQTGTIDPGTQTSLVLRDRAGWRTQWLIEGLQPSINHTFFVLDGGKVSGPVQAVTKSDQFACSLVHSLPFCPTTAYSVPLPAPNGRTTYDATSLPTTISQPILASLQNFARSLLTFACGRDIYSPLQTCEGCMEAYRSWVCAVSFPRCGEAPPPALQPRDQAVFQLDSPPAMLMHPPNDPPRISSLAPLDRAYAEILPCLETCQVVDRACPATLQWTCPLATVNANASYGVGFIDSVDGRKDQGKTGRAFDESGRTWCNM